MKALDLFLLGGLAYVLAQSATGGFKPSQFEKVADDTFKQINAAEQAGTITPDKADALRRQFGSIDSPRAGVDFINAASATGVFIQPRQKPREVFVPARLPGESLTATAERQRAQLAAITAAEAQRVGVAQQSDAYYAARDRKRAELSATPAGSNRTAAFSEIEQFDDLTNKARAWLASHPKPGGRAANDWRRLADNYKRRVLIREARSLSSAIRRSLADRKQDLGPTTYGNFSAAVVDAEKKTIAEINTIIKT